MKFNEDLCRKIYFYQNLVQCNLMWKISGRSLPSSKISMSNDITTTQMNEAIKFDREITQISYVG